MIHWFLHTIGVSDEILTHLGQASPAFQHPSALWIGLPLMLPLGWFIYQRQRMNLGGISRRLQNGLTATRVIILLILIFVLSGPYLSLDQSVEKRPILAYFLDDSQSMALPAGPFDDEAEMKRISESLGYTKNDDDTRKTVNHLSRAKLAVDALTAKREQLVTSLADKFDLRFYRLAELLERLPTAAPAWALSESKTQGTSTRLGDGIAEVIEEAAGREIAGIVLLSDGQNNAGLSPTEAARSAGEVSAPIFSVPCGSEAPVRDLSVADLFAPDLVSVGDTVHVSATIALQGYQEAAVEVLLLDGTEKTPLSRKEMLLHNTEPQTVDLSFEAKRPGPRTLTVKAVPKTSLPDNLSENDSDSVVVRVSDEKLRVLYIEGPPRWQFRFLKNSMRRDHGLGGLQGKTPDIVLENEAHRQPNGMASVLPKTLDELAKYHTVILGDASPQLISPKFAEMLSEAVRDRGVGLIVASGPLNMPGRYGAQLTDLLPVRMRRTTAGIDAPVYKPFRLEVSPSGAIHDTMRLYDDPDRNNAVWTNMPLFYWCAAVERPSAGATVLAWNSSLNTRYGKMPLVVHHYAGQGKVFFVGIDSTWGWRQNVGDRFFYKFWGQAIRFAARRNDDDQKKKSWLEVRPLRAQPGEQVEIELFAITPEGAPRQDPKISLRLFAGDRERTIELVADRNGQGHYTGQFLAEKAGVYRMAFEPGKEDKTVEAQIQVADSSVELRRPNINMPVLRQLGKIVPLDQLSSIPDQLKGEVKRIDVHRESTIWDNWLVLLILVTVYCVDIGLRRLSGLS